MTELEMKTEAEVEDFTDDLTDEALERAVSAACMRPASASPTSRQRSTTSAPGVADRDCADTSMPQPLQRSTGMTRRWNPYNSCTATPTTVSYAS